MGEGESVLAWGQQRSRELANRLLDDAYRSGQHVRERADGLRRLGWVTIDKTLDVPAVLRDWRESLALALRRRGSNAVETTLDLAWSARQGAAWLRARRLRIAALAAAPLVSFLALVVTFSSETVGGSALAAAPSQTRDAARVAAVEGEGAAARTPMARAKAASRTARVNAVR